MSVYSASSPSLWSLCLLASNHVRAHALSDPHSPYAHTLFDKNVYTYIYICICICWHVPNQLKKQWVYVCIYVSINLCIYKDSCIPFVSICSSKGWTRQRAAKLLGLWSSLNYIYIYIDIHYIHDLIHPHIYCIYIYRIYIYIIL